jgi:hypothetical protein
MSLYVRDVTYADRHTAKRKPHQNLSIGRPALPFLQRVDEFPLKANWPTLKKEVKHDEGADGDIEEDGQPQEVFMGLLLGPLQEGSSQTGFHDSRENDIDDFQEENELEWRRYFVNQMLL